MSAAEITDKLGLNQLRGRTVRKIYIMFKAICWRSPQGRGHEFEGRGVSALESGKWGVNTVKTIKFEKVGWCMTPPAFMVAPPLDPFPPVPNGFIESGQHNYCQLIYINRNNGKMRHL